MDYLGSEVKLTFILINLMLDRAKLKIPRRMTSKMIITDKHQAKVLKAF